MAEAVSQWVPWSEAQTEALGTGGVAMPDVLEPGPKPTQTSATTPVDNAARRTELWGWLRNLTTAVKDAVAETHQLEYTVELRVRTSELGGVGGQALLAELADLGFAWRDIARMVGVSVPALQKWRRGDGLTGENARKLALLVAGCEIIRKFNPLISDVALWFEVPIVDEAPVTPVDLWASGNQHLVFEHARIDMSSRVDPYTTMDSFDPNWRETYRSDFETFTAADGELSIRIRDR